jgi:hypothetical protein
MGRIHELMNAINNSSCVTSTPVDVDCATHSQTHTPPPPPPPSRLVTLNICACSFILLCAILFDGIAVYDDDERNFSYPSPTWSSIHHHHLEMNEINKNMDDGNRTRFIT